MATIHPTALVDDTVELADDVEVGPHCVLRGSVKLGAGTRLIGNVYLEGPLEMGAGNTVYPFVCLGFAAQHTAVDPATPGEGLVIGTDNTFREHVTVHRAFTSEGPTTIGGHNYFMAGAHVGHDSRIGDHCMLVNQVCLGGHVTIQDRVTVGGGTVIHQFCRVGRGAMLTGGAALSQDLAPWFMLTGTNVCGAVNLVGLRRQGTSSEEIDEIRWVYRTLYRGRRSKTTALEILRERRDRPVVAEYVRFLEGGKRTLCSGIQKASRGVAAPALSAG